MWNMQFTYIYGHFSYDYVAAFFNTFESYHLTPNNHIDYNPICKYLMKLLQDTPFYATNKGVQHDREEPVAKQVAIRLIYISYKRIWGGRE